MFRERRRRIRVETFVRRPAPNPNLATLVELDRRLQAGALGVRPVDLGEDQ